MVATIVTLSGSVRTTTSVRTQLIVSIMMMMPMTVSSDEISCVRFCCSVLLMLSRSFTARLRISPCVRESKNLQRQARELGLDFLAHRIYGLLRDARHQVLLQVQERRAHHVEHGQPGQVDPT